MVQQFSRGRFHVRTHSAVSASLNQIPRIGIVFTRIRPRYGRRGKSRMHGYRDASRKANGNKREQDTRSRARVAIHTQPALCPWRKWDDQSNGGRAGTRTSGLLRVKQESLMSLHTFQTTYRIAKPRAPAKTAGV